MCGSHALAAAAVLLAVVVGASAKGKNSRLDQKYKIEFGRSNMFTDDDGADLSWDGLPPPSPHAPRPRVSSSCPLEDPSLDAKRQRGPRSGQVVRWLHFPKTATTFHGTVLHYACPGYDRLTMNVVSKEPGSMPGGRTARFSCRPEKGGRLSVYATKNGNWAGHMPWRRVDGNQTVTIFREPISRLASQVAYSLYVAEGLLGFGLSSKSLRGYFSGHDKSTCAGHEPCRYVHMAEYPGSKGCYTKMLTGFRCMQDVAITEQMVQTAIRNVENMAFVGILEHYNASVRLFHRQFGGITYPEEFSMLRTGFFPNRARVVRHALRDVSDPWDERVYAAALARFEREMRDVDPRCVLVPRV